MKKFLSLAAALLMFVGGAKAQTVVAEYSMTDKTSESFTYTTNCSYVSSSSKIQADEAGDMEATVTGTPISFVYTSSSANKGIIKLSSTSYVQADGAKVGVKVTGLTEGQSVILNISATSSSKAVELSAESGSTTTTSTTLSSSTATDLEYIADATGTMVIRGGDSNGFRLYKVTIQNNNPSLVGAWSETEVKATVGDTDVTAPTFSVSASTGDDITSSDYSVAYSLADGSTDGIVTLDASTGITAISTATAGTATVVATVTSNNTSYESPSSTYETTITVSPAATEYEQASISAATPWDFTTIGSTVELTESSDPSKTDEILLANLPYYGYDVELGDEFQSLSFIGQFPVRSGYSQGSTWKFNTTVPGYVEVEAATTGSSNTGRYIQMNGNSTVFTPSTTKAVASPKFYVSAGNVAITSSDSYLRAYTITFTPASLETKTLDVNGYTTVTSDYAFTVTGATAYTASVDGETVTLTAVDGAVPAGTGVVLVGDANGTATIVPATSDDTAAEISSNALVGVSSVTTALNDGTNYVLANDGTDTKFVQAGTATVDQLTGKAYINVATSEAKSLNISFGEATGISEVAVEAEATNNAMYNLAGQRVNAAAKGIVIMNGKKYVNR